jgi:hypothetical protein
LHLNNQFIAIHWFFKRRYTCPQVRTHSLQDHSHNYEIQDRASTRTHKGTILIHARRHPTTISRSLHIPSPFLLIFLLSFSYYNDIPLRFWSSYPSDGKNYIVK